MDLDAKPLRCFVAVAEEGSFSAAARRMNMTQPSLSAQIKGLEHLLGFELFLRTTRRVSLTPQGEAFLRGAERMIAEASRLKRTAESLRRSGEKRLSLGAAFYTIDIPERIQLIESFIGAHPEVSVDVDTRWQNELLRDFQAGELDFVLAIGMRVGRDTLDELSASHRVAEILYPDDLKRIVLRREPIELLVPAELPFANDDPVPLSALEGQRVAMFSALHGDPITRPVAEMLEQAGAEPVVPPEPHGIGVERYGRQFRIPAITLGWFGRHDNDAGSMVRRHLAGLDMETELVLLGSPDISSPQIEALWEFAADLAEERTKTSRS